MSSKNQNFSEDYFRRFAGMARLYGTAGLKKIQQAKFLIIGIGGVGSWAAEALARSGVETISLMDMDEVCLSNVNRQIHALTDNVGHTKTTVMADRLKQINPNIQINVIDDFLNKNNIEHYINHENDYIIDAIDGVISKSALIAHCKRQKIPLLTVGGAGGQRNPSAIKIKDLSRTSGDPLLSKVRNELRRHYNFPRNVRNTFGISAVYSDEQLYYPHPDASVSHARPPNMDATQLDCQTGFGAASFVTASFAFKAVSYLLEKITQQP